MKPHILFLVLTLLTAAAPLRAAPARLELKPNDRVVFIGNTFSERLAWHGYFEALLTSRFPEIKPTFRNLGFSGDEVFRGTLGTGAGPGTLGKFEENVFLQLRALNFGDIFTHLEQQKADVIFACYGMNESFAGRAGLAKFEKDLTYFLTRLVDLRCGARKSSPRLVLVSPIPHESLAGDLPDPGMHNANLKAYSETMRKVAGAFGIPFVDLFNTMKPLMEDKSASPLTFNGIHLTRYGNWVAAQVMMDQLGLGSEPLIIRAAAPSSGDVTLPGLELTSLPVAPPPVVPKVHEAFIQRLPLVTVKGLRAGSYKLRIGGRDVAEAGAADWERGLRVVPGPALDAAGQLVRAVDDKNWEFFMKYRAVNGEYIYGRRKEPFGVVNFPKEREYQEQLVAEKDGNIHELARAPGLLKVDLVKTEK